VVNIRSEPPRWTFIFIGICTLAFIIQQFTVSWIYFAFFPKYALIMPWTFVTSIFLHADISHLMLNMLALFFFGLALESTIGRKRFALLFIISGVVGNIGYYLTAINPAIPAIGSSGAVYGIIGALTAITPFRMVWIYGILPIPLVVAAALWVLIDLTGLFLPTGIAHGAHLGGILVGILYGLYFKAKLRKGYYW